MKIHLHSVKNYFLVAKPGIVLGNLVTAGGGFLLASKGRFDAGVLQSTLIGISLIVACGCILNNCVDRNLDRKMARTQNRALARGLISPTAAVVYASMLGIAGITLLEAATNALCTAIVLTGLGIYVGVYSLWLKRRSIYSTIIGSLAGAAPPLAGYCAVTNRFDLGALILLSIFCLWQIPHSYAIAVLRFEDYTAAAVPVLPVKRGPAAAKKQIVGHILVFMATAPMLTIGGYTGDRFLAAALATGLAWLYLAWSGFRTTDDRLWAKRLFVFSILGITVLCVMMAIDFTMPASPHLLLTYAP
jgi:heme o synthase